VRWSSSLRQRVRRSAPRHDLAACHRIAVAGGEQRLERIDGRAVGPAVDQAAAEMALERGDDGDRRLVEIPVGLIPKP